MQISEKTNGEKKEGTLLGKGGKGRSLESYRECIKKCLKRCRHPVTGFRRSLGKTQKNKERGREQKNRPHNRRTIFKARDDGRGGSCIGGLGGAGNGRLGNQRGTAKGTGRVSAW